MGFMTKPEFDQLQVLDKYWKGRWGYFNEVINVLKNEKFDSVLELGPYKRPIVDDCDVMDFNPLSRAGFATKNASDLNKIEEFPKIKYLHDAKKCPWPIPDKKYDLFIALQVLEHLGVKQKDVFKEIMRVSNMAILSFPLNWRCFGDCHHLITEKKIRDWTLHIRPTKKIIVPMYTIKHRIRYFIENMKFPPSRIIYFFKFYR
jgi:hypothetical protein